MQTSCERRLKMCLSKTNCGYLAQTNQLSDAFRGKLVVVGSAAQGNDLTDRGATPLENDTLLVSKHWNVANSIITGQFIRRASLPLEFAIIIFLARSRPCSPGNYARFRRGPGFCF